MELAVDRFGSELLLGEPRLACSKPRAQSEVASLARSFDKVNIELLVSLGTRDHPFDQIMNR